MNTRRIDITAPASGALSRRIVAVGLPVIATLALFGVGTATDGVVGDPGLLPIVRFMGALKLVVALSAAAAVGLRYARLPRRWLAGQAGAVCMGLGAGLIWSASAFLAGFAFFMAGLSVAALLVIGEVGRSYTRHHVSRRATDPGA